jgi:phytoene dehydrogenase-like protein
MPTQTYNQATVPSSADVVVVGAGLGGLGSGLELARQGTKVLVLEQHNLPGGFATSFVRGRFEFEPSLHQMPSPLPDSRSVSVRNYLLQEAELDLEVAEVPEAYRLILTERSVDVRIPFGIQAVTDLVEARVPGSRASVSRYFDLCREVLDTLTYLDQHREDLNRKELLAHHRNFLNTGGYTVQQVTDAVGVPPRAQEILYAYWCFLGVPASRLSFTLWGAMLCTYLASGAFIPRSRSHGLASAMVQRIEELGGRVEFNQRVTGIGVHGGKIREIQTAGGSRIRTERVICNASPSLVFNRLVEPQKEVPRRARRLVNARRHGVSTFVVYLGLNKSPEELGLDGYSYFISPHMDTESIYESTGRLEPPLMQASVCLNSAIPDCSPPGTTIVSLTCCYQPHVWEQVPPQDYFRTKSEIGRAMIGQFEDAVGVDLSDHVEEIEIATPVTFQRYTGAYRGIVYGYEPDPWDSLVPRALAIEKESFFEGLQFCGGYSTRCHGYGSSILSGRAAAQRSLEAVS